jgi:hypothetical protein
MANIYSNHVVDWEKIFDLKIKGNYDVNSRDRLFEYIEVTKSFAPLNNKRNRKSFEKYFSKRSLKPSFWKLISQRFQQFPVIASSEFDEISDLVDVHYGSYNIQVLGWGGSGTLFFFII